MDYVFDRPIGEPEQELGGALVTLTALANCHDMHLMQAGENELARVWTKIDKIRAKQAAKPKHSPLPEHVVTPAQAVGTEVRPSDLMQAIDDAANLFEEDVDAIASALFQKFDIRCRAAPPQPVRCNVPFERLPQHADDPGSGPVPNDNSTLMETVNGLRTITAAGGVLNHQVEHELSPVFAECAEIALEHVGAGPDYGTEQRLGYDEACRDIAAAIRTRASNRKVMDALVENAATDLPTAEDVRGILAPAAPQEVQWQPIETAPRDGTGFLACVGKWQTVCCWNKHRNNWCAVAPGYPNYESGEYPTHWRPLPDPALSRPPCTPTEKTEGDQS